jgi:ABC-type antimicrobial peptide transport system permease subunit
MFAEVRFTAADYLPARKAAQLDPIEALARD